MKSVLALIVCAAAVPAWAKPLVVPDNAWRQSTLTDFSPMLRPCLPRADQVAPARLPVAKEPVGNLQISVVLQEPASLGQGYWYRIGWRAADGNVFIVGARSPDGQRVVFGPVGSEWACLPADVRKELAK
jgi:hypothetical protein